MDELPEESIEEAAGSTDAHGHAGVTEEDTSLYDHLLRVHELLDAPAGLSPATLRGLHDRLHGRSRAAEQ